MHCLLFFGSEVSTWGFGVGVVYSGTFEIVFVRILFLGGWETRNLNFKYFYKV